MPKPDAGGIVVAVTGGIGAGKSTLCRLLRARPGVAHIDADRVVRGLLAGSPQVARAVSASLGAGVLTRAGRVDRRRLAARVFTDRRALARVEAILHPIVLVRLARRAAALKRRPEVAIVLVEIPLLVEVGVPDWCEVVVTIEAARDKRLKRLAARGLAPRDARRRMARQTGDARRRRVADYVVRNNGTMGVLERDASRLWRRLVARARRSEPHDGSRRGRARDQRGRTAR